MNSCSKHSFIPCHTIYFEIVALKYQNKMDIIKKRNIPFNIRGFIYTHFYVHNMNHSPCNAHETLEWGVFSSSSSFLCIICFILISFIFTVLFDDHDELFRNIFVSALVVIYYILQRKKRREICCFLFKSEIENSWWWCVRIMETY